MMGSMSNPAVQGRYAMKLLSALDFERNATGLRTAL